jgi:CubicO group peptidase (beta-lactamase class C family)
MTVDETELEDRIETWLADHAHPGVSVAVVDGAETVFATGAGKRRLDPEQPATPETLYRVGSVTKSLTATTVFTVVEDGTLELDDPVAEYVPTFDPPGDPVTVGELLSHTSGMPNDGFAARLAAENLGSDTEVDADLHSWEGFEAFLAAHADDRLPDRRHHQYYNSGYVVLGRLVETVTDAPYRGAVRKRVLEPLGMERATFDVDVVNRHGESDDDGFDIACPYEPDGEDGAGFVPVSASASSLLAPGGGLVASVRDLAAFASGLASGNFPVGASLRDRMVTPVATAAEYLDGRTRGYAYGFDARPFDGDTLVGHPGNVDGGSAYVGVLRDRGVGVAVACNAIGLGPDSPSKLATEVLALATGRDPATVSPSIERQLEPITGRYESVDGLREATVTWDSGTLELELQTPFETRTMEFVPGEARPDRRTFREVGPDGELVKAEFLTDREPVECLAMGLRLRRVDPDAGTEN